MFTYRVVKMQSINFLAKIYLIVLFSIIILSGCTGPKNIQGVLKRPLPDDGSRLLLDCNHNGWLFDSQEVRHRPFSLSSPSYYEAGEDLGRLVVDDFNHDGKLDIAVTNPTIHKVSIIFNNGAGGYSDSPPIELHMTDRPIFITSGDFNGDGYRDLAVSHNANDIVIFLNDDSAPGTFTATTRLVAESPGSWSIHGLAAADINGDDISEVLVTSSHSSTKNLTVLRNGSGILDSIEHFDLHFTSSPTTLAVADMDGDGDTDIAVATTGVIKIYTNSGTGEFSSERYEMPGTVAHLAFGDLNRDGLPELVSTRHDGGLNYRISVLLNQSHDGTISFDDSSLLTIPFVFPILELQMSDVDNDGYRDLLATGDNAIHILLNKGDNTYEHARRVEVANATHLVNAPLNRINPDDIIVISNSAHPQIAVFLNESRIARDCNNNRRPDECDLAADTRSSLDCNANKVPDECDLQAIINLSPREFSFFRSPFFLTQYCLILIFEGLIRT